MTIACEDVVDIELPQGPVQLVVDAELSRAVGGLESASKQITSASNLRD